MSNVLSTEEKRKLGRRLRARYIAALGIVLALGGMLASLALAPAFVSVAIARASFGQEGAEGEADRANGVAAARAQTLLDALSPLLGATTTPSMIVGEALALAPEGIAITDISHQNGMLRLAGSSTGRAAVSAYQAALEGSGLFSQVVVPVAALVAAEGGAFSVMLTLK